MRSSIKLVLTLIVSISFYGCQKYLDIVPDNIATMDDAFKDQGECPKGISDLL